LLLLFGKRGCDAALRTGTLPVSLLSRGVSSSSPPSLHPTPPPKGFVFLLLPFIFFSFLGRGGPFAVFWRLGRLADDQQHVQVGGLGGPQEEGDIRW